MYSFWSLHIFDYSMCIYIRLPATVFLVNFVTLCAYICHVLMFVLVGRYVERRFQKSNCYWSHTVVYVDVYILVLTGVIITNNLLCICCFRKPLILPARQLRRIKLRTMRRLCTCTNLLFSTSSMWWNVRHKTAYWHYVYSVHSFIMTWTTMTCKLILILS